MGPKGVGFQSSWASASHGNTHLHALVIDYFVKGNIPFQENYFHIGLIQVVMNTNIDPFKTRSIKHQEGSNLDVKTLFLKWKC